MPGEGGVARSTLTRVEALRDLSREERARLSLTEQGYRPHG
jgi:hypothetical protein